MASGNTSKGRSTMMAPQVQQPWTGAQPYAFGSMGIQPAQSSWRNTMMAGVQQQPAPTGKGQSNGKGQGGTPMSASPWGGTLPGMLTASTLPGMQQQQQATAQAQAAAAAPPPQQPAAAPPPAPPPPKFQEPAAVAAMPLDDRRFFQYDPSSGSYYDTRKTQMPDFNYGSFAP